MTSGMIDPEASGFRGIVGIKMEIIPRCYPGSLLREDSGLQEISGVEAALLDHLFPGNILLLHCMDYSS